MVYELCTAVPTVACALPEIPRRRVQAAAAIGPANSGVPPIESTECCLAAGAEMPPNVTVTLGRRKRVALDKPGPGAATRTLGNGGGANGGAGCDDKRIKARPSSLS